MTLRTSRVSSSVQHDFRSVLLSVKKKQRQRVWQLQTSFLSPPFVTDPSSRVLSPLATSGPHICVKSIAARHAGS